MEHFLSEGHKVKVTLTFRGREVYHPELGKKILDQVEQAVKDVGRVEIFPRIDGRNMTMVLAPDKRAQAAALKAAAAAAAEAEGPSPESPMQEPTPVETTLIDDITTTSDDEVSVETPIEAAETEPAPAEDVTDA